MAAGKPGLWRRLQSTVAVGVISRYERAIYWPITRLQDLPSGRSARKPKVVEQANEDRRRIRQAIENDKDQSLPWKFAHRARGTERRTYDVGYCDRGSADLETQQRDSEEVRVAGDDTLECLCSGFTNAVHGSAPCALSGQ
jgi:hypothetical protein